MLNVFPIVLLTLISCKSKNQVLVEENFQNDSRITLIDSDEYSGIYESETLVIRDMKTLSKFYSKVNRTRKPGLPVPTIDFSKYTALVICAGEQKPNSKMALSFGNEGDDNHLEINISVKRSNPSGDTQITVVAYPFYLYTIPLTDKSIGFQYLK